MKYAQYQQLIAKDEIKPLYVLTGKERFLKEEAVHLLKKRLGEDRFFFREYEPENFPLNNFVSDIYARPLFEEWNLLIVKNAASLVTVLYEPLKKYLAAPPPGSVVVIELEKMDQKTRFARLASTEAVVVVECDSLKQKSSRSMGSELTKWIMGRAAHYQKKMDPATADYLGALVGSELTDLDLQIQKLISFVHPRDAITEKDIRNLVEDRQRTDIFELMDAIFMRQASAALRLIHRLFQKGSVSQDGEILVNPNYIALQCIRLIHYRLKQIWKFSIRHDEDIPQFIQWKLQRQARLFTRDMLSAIWNKLLEIEFALKTSRLEPETAMDQLILFISAGCKREKINL